MPAVEDGGLPLRGYGWLFDETVTHSQADSTSGRDLRARVLCRLVSFAAVALSDFCARTV